MYSRRPARWAPNLGGLTGGPPAPRDLLVLLGVVFATFALQFFATTRPFIDALRLSPALWQRGLVWQLATYGFAGYGPPSVWFLLELLMLFWFGRDVFWKVRRKGFWGLLAWGLGAAGAVAVLAQLTLGRLPGGTGLLPFQLIQGQHILLVVMIAAFATLNRHATIYLMFVLPIQARWFLPLEILFGFIGFLATRDLSGFLGLVAAVGITWSILTPGGARGLLRRFLREPWLRLQRRRYARRLQDLERGRGWDRTGKRKEEGGEEPSGRGGDGKVRRGPWVN